MLTIRGTLLWDRLVTAIFAPKIFGAMMESARATTLLDFWPAVKTMLMIVVGVGVFASGNVVRCWSPPLRAAFKTLQTVALEDVCRRGFRCAQLTTRLLLSGLQLLWGGAAYLFYRRRKANAEAALE